MKKNNFSLINTPNDLLMGFDGVLGATLSTAPDSSMSVAPTSRFNMMFPSQSLPIITDAVQSSPISLGQQVKSTDKAPLEKTNESEDDEVFTSEEEVSGDDKILGMPKGVVIGVGIAIVAIGVFLIYKKYKK